MSILTDKEILEMAHDGIFLQSIYEITRDIESLVIEKIKAQGGVVRRITTQDSMTGEITMNEEILYRLPEGD